MAEDELDGILRNIAHERYVPSEKLLRRTKSAIRGRRVFHVVAFLSLGMQGLGVGTCLYLLMSPEVGPVARTFMMAGLTAFFGAVAVTVLAARNKIVWFFRRVELLTG